MAGVIRSALAIAALTVCASPASASFIFSNTTPHAIPDGPGGVVTSEIVVPLAFAQTITDVDVRIDVTHTWDSDLVISLIGPVGMATSVLSNRRGGDGDNFRLTLFSDEASTPISAGVAPFASVFRPESLLSVFDGTNSLGTWTLRITDTTAQDVGVLNAWELHVEGITDPVPDPVPEPTSLLLFGTGVFVAIAVGRRRRCRR